MSEAAVWQHVDDDECGDRSSVQPDLPSSTQVRVFEPQCLRLGPVLEVRSLYKLVSTPKYHTSHTIYYIIKLSRSRGIIQQILLQMSATNMDLLKEAGDQKQSFRRKSREALLNFENQENDKAFRFTKMWDLKGNSCLLQLVLVGALVMYMMIVIALTQELDEYRIYIAAIVVVNLGLLMLIGHYLIRSILFPYSNFFIRTQMDSVINQRFSQEFGRLLQQLHKCLRILSDQDGPETLAEFKRLQLEQAEGGKGSGLVQGDAQPPITSEMLSVGPPASESGKENRGKDKKRYTTEINSKMVAVCELIGLYSEVNQDIIDRNLHTISPYYRAVTQHLREIKEKVAAISIEVPSPAGQKDASQENQRFQNIWNFYRKDLVEENANPQLGGSFTILPTIPNTIENLKLIGEIGELSEDFVLNVNLAVRQRCCFFCCYTKMFGTTEQNMILLNKNFEGKHFWVNGHGGARLDCMFFPCTVEDSAVISVDNPVGEYLDKPTVIMCNPNALIYQQMVTSPNSYWLSFFLKRGINVMCWNYRDYGNSTTGGLFGRINPYNCKLDAERVLDFLLNQMKLRGKIGVYGRSLGGIASCHLANKFPKIVQTLLVDRTFNEVAELSYRRLPGRCTKFLYRLISFNWTAWNDRNFIEAQCYKIVTCDPLDDVVDNLSSLPVGVATKYAKNRYQDEIWKTFFNSLTILHQLEDILFRKLKDFEKEFLYSRISSNLESGINLPAGFVDLPKLALKESINQGSRQSTDSDLEKSRGQTSPSNSLIRSQFNQAYIRQQTSRLENFKDLHEHLYQLIVSLHDFQAGSIALRDMVNGSRNYGFADFQIFLKTLEVYGVGHNDDIDRSKYNNRQNYTHEQQGVMELEQLIGFFSKVKGSLQQKSVDQVFNGDSNLKGHYEVLIDFITEGFQECVLILKSRPVKTDFDTKTQGHLVLMTCGHRGRPSRQEEKRISRLLRKSGFIPMLEEIYGIAGGGEAGPQGAKEQKIHQSTPNQPVQLKTETPKYVGAKLFGKQNSMIKPPTEAKEEDFQIENLKIQMPSLGSEGEMQKFRLSGETEPEKFGAEDRVSSEQRKQQEMDLLIKQLGHPNID